MVTAYLYISNIGRLVHSTKYFSNFFAKAFIPPPSPRRTFSSLCRCLLQKLWLFIAITGCSFVRFAFCKSELSHWLSLVIHHPLYLNIEDFSYLYGKYRTNKMVAYINRIKEVLEEKGIKQTWLDEKLGKSFSIVNSYVCNCRQPSLEMLFEIARILQVSPKDLIESKE